MNTMKKVMLTGLTAAMMSGTTLAAEVGAITTFSSGSPALASEVNANFQALIAAINDNNARIAALEANVDEPTDLLGKISGATYRIRYLGTHMNMFTNTGSGQQSGSTNIWNGSLTVVFNEGGSASITEHGEATGEMNVEPIEQCDEFTCVDSFVGRYNFEQGGGGSSTGSWSLNGARLTLTFQDGFEAEFDVTPNAQLLVNTEGVLGDEAIGGGTIDTVESSIAIGIRQP